MTDPSQTKPSKRKPQEGDQDPQILEQAVKAPVKGTILRSLDRGLRVLELLGQHPESLSVSNVGNLLGSDKSTAHHILNTLRHKGYADQDPLTRRYSLGVKLLHLGFQVSRKLDIIQTARPILQEAVERLGATAHIAKLAGGHVVYVDKVQSSQTLVIVSSEVGQLAPAHCTASGKVLLAFSTPSTEFDSMLDDIKLTPMTPNTISDREQLKRHLFEIRRQGYSVDHEEYRKGIICVGAPIFNYEHRAIAAISCSWPEAIVRNRDIKGKIPIVIKTSMAISRALGYDR